MNNEKTAQEDFKRLRTLIVDGDMWSMKGAIAVNKKLRDIQSHIPENRLLDLFDEHPETTLLKTFVRAYEDAKRRLEDSHLIIVLFWYMRAVRMKLATKRQFRLLEEVRTGKDGGRILQYKDRMAMSRTCLAFDLPHHMFSLYRNQGFLLCDSEETVLYRINWAELMMAENDCLDKALRTVLDCSPWIRSCSAPTAIRWNQTLIELDMRINPASVSTLKSSRLRHIEEIAEKCNISSRQVESIRTSILMDWRLLLPDGLADRSLSGEIIRHTQQKVYV